VQRAVTSVAPPGRPGGGERGDVDPPAQRRGGLSVPAAAHRVRGRPTVGRHPAHRVLHREWLSAGTVGGLGARRPGRGPRRAGRRRAHRGAGTSPAADEARGKQRPRVGRRVELPGKRLARRRGPDGPPVRARLAADLPSSERADAVAGIVAEERRRRMPSAVAGFDLTFTMPKSASVLWALADPDLQARIAQAHRDTVNDVLAVLERDALYTRTGHAGAAQIATRGAIAACFDHWDTRAGDPNLHSHLVLANKVQGQDGRWRSVDSRALHHAAVALSELYDDLLADRLSAVAAVGWAWRGRGPRRTPAFEIEGIGDGLLREFSTRSVHAGAARRLRRMGGSRRPASDSASSGLLLTRAAPARRGTE
jgi:conjugative relaxase-like TrwC/TraI family protein